MVQGGATCVKYLLFFFNLIFVITGLTLIIVGALVQSRAKDYYDFVEGNVISAAILLIVVGVVIFFIAFFGCCGAYKENHCMVMTFAVLLFIIFIMELAGGISAYVFKDKFPGLLTDGMNESFAKYNQTEVKKTWEDMQKNLKCCGVNNVSDYENILHMLPSETCKISNDNSTEPEYYAKGCAQTIIDDFQANIPMIGGVGVGIAFVQIVGIVFACCLSRAIKKQYEVV